MRTFRSRRWLAAILLVGLMLTPAAAGDAQPRWLLGTAYHIPSEYTNQESGYFSIVEGKDGKVYVGTAK